jgi:deazaflavin-dependent oxidoreductase (nitroreductase family)
VVNILEAEPLPQPVERPAGFDLAAFWQEWTERYERGVYTAEATVRMTAPALDRMAYVFPPEMARVARANAGETGPDGWLQTVIPIESIKHGHIELLKLGADAEVLAPAELRERFTETARGLATTYLTAPGPTDGRNSAVTMPDDLLAHNRQLIAQFRADGGVSMGDRPLLLLSTLGRQSGQTRTSPMMYVREQGRLLVIASNNGAAADPEWYRNLLADPKVKVEVPGEEFPATATPLNGDDYAEVWTRVKEKFPFFAEHEKRAGDRKIPVVALTKAE